MRALILVATTALLGACVEANLVSCPDVVCPSDKVCHERTGCVYAEQRDCAGIVDGAACSYPGVEAGICSEGLCVPATCGDGVQVFGEVCDDGNNRNGDGCSADCSSDETCGNGEVDALQSEQCDEGAANSTAPDATCRPNCRPGRCGDSIVDTFEACDDGNTINGDDCSEDCRSTEACGNGIVDPGEQCDDGALNSNAPGEMCRLNCRVARCGDGIADPGEQCDQLDTLSQTCNTLGFDTGDLACTQFCSLDTGGCEGYCGDGVRGPGEACDQTDFLGSPTVVCQGLVPPQYPPQAPVVPICGPTCEVVPTTCGGRCGDGFKNGPEQCDGNAFGGEDCDSWTGGSGYGGNLICTTSCQIDDAGCNCGDSTCSAIEECGQAAYCYDDCGPCCGDNVCDSEEECGGGSECALDCDACYCGNGSCDAGEECGQPSQCNIDCGPCYTCGNMACEPDEACGEDWECEDDCGPCS